MNYDPSHLHRYIENLIKQRNTVTMRAINAEFSMQKWRLISIVQFLLIAAAFAFEVFK